ncbi:hypothetical protein DM860_010997 [Cuscuta australis]|uniref:Uncharacterized protein n=1 Tax=Cuscuta australis TaxID=267555 RepID=A0A328E0I3_9ASTE|nr:hypothetical protein DM860_010997 [Cuscuta australis]
MGSRYKEVRHHEPAAVPKGFVVGIVGGTREFEEQRTTTTFFIPVTYLNHRLFLPLLIKEAEEEYGFNHGGGPIRIPCSVAEFRRVHRKVHEEASTHPHSLVLPLTLLLFLLLTLLFYFLFYKIKTL